MDLGAMAVCADWENVNGLNPLLHEPSEPSEPPVVKTSPERLTRALHPAPIEDAYHGAVFGNLGIALPRADRRLRHRPLPEQVRPKRHGRRQWCARSARWWRSLFKEGKLQHKSCILRRSLSNAKARASRPSFPLQASDMFLVDAPPRGTIA